MKELPQQFIANYLSDSGAPVPNTFLDPEFSEKLDMRGFRLPSNDVFGEYVAAINRRFPERIMVPFGQSKSSDDTVGFLLDHETHTIVVVVIHDYATPGWENPLFYNSLTDWLEQSSSD